MGSAASPWADIGDNAGWPRWRRGVPCWYALPRGVIELRLVGPDMRSTNARKDGREQDNASTKPAAVPKSTTLDDCVCAGGRLVGSTRIERESTGTTYPPNPHTTWARLNLLAPHSTIVLHYAGIMKADRVEVEQWFGDYTGGVASFLCHRVARSMRQKIGLSNQTKQTNQ